LVIAGLVPATTMLGHGCARTIGVAGDKPGHDGVNVVAGQRRVALDPMNSLARA
jgi:hypothetical protein